MIDHHFELTESEFLEYENFVPLAVDLDQTLGHARIKRLVDLAPTYSPRQLIHDDQLARSMTHLRANFEYALCLMFGSDNLIS